MNSTILVCDDTEPVRDSICDYLANDRFHVLAAADGESALKIIRENHVDLVVLDIMLPGMSGLEVLKEIRDTFNIPVLLLSAKGSQSDRIAGLETGADDYVTKPFSLRELSIRIQRILERLQGNKGADNLSFSDLTLYPEDNRATVINQVVELTPKETRVLSFLLGRAEKLASREQILNAVWGYEYFGDTRVVDTLIKRIRKKIIFPGIHFTIQTVYGSGYMIEEILPEEANNQQAE